MNERLIMSFSSYLIRTIGVNKGKPRVYLDMLDLLNSAFLPGAKYRRQVEDQKITLILDENGEYCVSKKSKGEKTISVIDLNSEQALKSFEGMSAVRVIIQTGRIFILPIASQINRLERLSRLSSSVGSHLLKTAASAFGGGILDHACHQGLKNSNLNSELVLANEIDDKLLGNAIENNEIITANTQLICSPIQELVQDTWAMKNIPTADIFCMGIPCSGASIAGKSKRGLSMMENHPEVGHLIASALMLINKINPAVIVIENVVQYSDTASAQILRQHLRDCGYSTHEIVLKGSDFGCIENRDRWFFVAVTQGIEFSFDHLIPTEKKSVSLSQFLENIPLDSDQWRSFDYLKSKQERDAEKGNSFSMQIVNENCKTVPVIRKGYHKGGSTDPLVAHPTKPDLLRQLTVFEHANIKGVPPHLVHDLSKTDGHIILGQGVLYQPVVELFKLIGESLLNWFSKGNLAVMQSVPYSLKLATG